MKNIAHRGFSGKYPENTKIAFTKAIELEADMIELDVTLSRDRVPVVIHDDMVDCIAYAGIVTQSMTTQFQFLRIGADGIKR